jgi:hemoglobin
MSEAASLPGVTDLSTRTEVHDLVVEFYREVVMDDLLSPLFGEVAEVDWAVHIPRLVDYWCAILLGAQRPSGSTFAVHRHLHELRAIEVEHCDRWYELWVRAVEARGASPVAARATSHAASMMQSMATHVFGFTWVPPPAAVNSGRRDI